MNFELEIGRNLLHAFGGILGLLVLASLIVRILKGMNPQKDYSELAARIRSWWVMVALFAIAVLLNRKLTLVFFAFLSFLALKEFFSMIQTRRADRRVLFWAYLAILVQYYWIATDWYGMFIIFIPVYVFLFLPFRMLLAGQTAGFLQSVSTIQWGLMITVFGMSHAAYLVILHNPQNPAAGGPALLLYLVFLTQFNDVAQYVWGKLFGRHKVTPTVSPKKTWEGLIGGVLTTAALSVLIAPWLTPMSFPMSLYAGLLIGISGFIGDVNISAVKRDMGVKDSGALIPGHGGILDRIDSLSYTAPLFFHFIRYFYF
jgi:phosphatidate cytidylyltransferase